VEMVIFGVYDDGLDDESLYAFRSGSSVMCSRRSYIRLVSWRLVMMIWL
jgi:hypothetical protein